MGVVYEAEQEASAAAWRSRCPATLAAMPNRSSLSARGEGRRAECTTPHRPVFDVGKDAEHVYYAMQMIHGPGPRPS